MASVLLAVTVLKGAKLRAKRTVQKGLTVRMDTKATNYALMEPTKTRLGSFFYLFNYLRWVIAIILHNFNEGNGKK